LRLSADLDAPYLDPGVNPGAEDKVKSENGNNSYRDRAGDDRDQEATGTTG
jgi:hypothetical protein